MHVALPSLEFAGGNSVLALDGQRLDIPDALGILVDATVAAEEPHAGDAGDALGDPLVLVTVSIVDQSVGLDVAVEIVRHQVVVAVVADGRDHAGEVVRVTERALLDGLEHLQQVGVYRVLAVRVAVAEVFDVLGQVAEQENVVLANLTSDLDLSGGG